MLRLQRPNSSAISILFFLALLAASFGLGITQGAPSGPQDNAIAKNNGNGWQCEHGYREDGNACVTYATASRAPQETCCAVEPVSVTGDAELERENARLRLEVDALSLKNSVLRSERDDE